MKKSPLESSLSSFLTLKNWKYCRDSCHFELAKGCETSSSQYMFTPFSGWDRLFMKKEYLSLSWLRGSLGYCFLPFRIWETIYEKGYFGFFFSAFFSNSLNMKRCRVLPLSDSLKTDDIELRRYDVTRVPPS